MKLKPQEIEIQNIDHLGIVAGMIDSIGIVEIINELIGVEKKRESKCRSSSKSHDNKRVRICIETLIYVSPIF